MHFSPLDYQRLKVMTKEMQLLLDRQVEFLAHSKMEFWKDESWSTGSGTF